MLLKTAVALQSMLLEMKDRMEDEEGQTFVEWLGVIAIIVVVVGVVAAAKQDIGDAIVKVAKDAISKVGNTF